jgi:protein-ribulosamine 3-kinase
MFWGDEQFTFFETILFQALGQSVEVIETQFLSGGNINTAAQVFSSEGVFFVKWNVAEPPSDTPETMFETEARGLDLLRRTDTVRVPGVVGHGQQGGKAYLILEHLDAEPPQPNYWEQLGQQLAELHSHTQPRFGLGFDNFIGTLPQDNTPTTNGIDFFFEKRLLPLAGQARYKGLISSDLLDRFYRLYRQLPNLLPHERPALLHGDLWTGNLLTDDTGAPALVDPAVYYGFREAELAFTQLFGGFDARFFAAYDNAFPLEPGFDERVPIYNLYPLLVHVNLFGTGYVSGLEKVLRNF